MHKKLTIENFKCFSDKTEIRLGCINVCLGSNSVGKSSVLQSLILIRQIIEKSLKSNCDDKGRTVIQLNDEYGLQLGDSEHIKSSKDKDDILFSVDDIEFKLSSIENNPLEMIAEVIKCNNLDNGLFAKDFYYLNAERLGPRNFQLIDSKVIYDCGVHGENTIHYLNVKGNNKVEASRRFDLDDEKKVNTVSKQVEYWMDFIIPGISIRSDDLNDLRLSKIQFQQTSLDTEYLSPYNLGFGISYVLPIIVTGLTANKGSVFLIENPEAHLHPKGQSHIGYFLAMMAFSGIQVVIETHSEHVLNGIRIAALKNGINPENISISFFSIVSGGGYVKHNVKNLKLNERMDIEEWPEGFLDQEENDLRTLRELRRTQCNKK